jgi:hypothetical protein
MRAAQQFVAALKTDGLLPRVASVRADLYGSLGATGKGHGSDKAVMLGLEGELPETIDTDSVEARLDTIRSNQQLNLLAEQPVAFDETKQLIMHRRRTLPFHSNGMTFQKRNPQRYLLLGGRRFHRGRERGRRRSYRRRRHPATLPVYHRGRFVDSLCQSQPAHQRCDAGK